MVRECRARVLAIALVAMTPACSFILDFDEALPTDAAVDGPYTQAECEYLEPNDTFFEAKPIAATDMGPAAICPPAAGGGEDHDFYKFTASGTTTTITINFTDRPGGDLDLKLYDSTGTMISSSREFGSTEMITCPGASPACPSLGSGEYTIEVFPGVAGSVNSYSFSIVQ